MSPATGNACLPPTPVVGSSRRCQFVGTTCLADNTVGVAPAGKKTATDYFEEQTRRLISSAQNIQTDINGKFQSRITQRVILIVLFKGVLTFS